MQAVKTKADCQSNAGHTAQMGEIRMKKVPELFGSMVFNEAVMKERLPKDVYKALKQTVRQGTALDPQVAGVVANAHEGLGD